MTPSNDATPPTTPATPPAPHAVDTARDPRALARRLTGRRGSVLILVVAVLVLLALMGTAYIASSRSDSVSASGNASIASVDSLANGVIETVKGRLATERTLTNGDLGTVMIPGVTGYASGFTNAYSPELSLIASRVPTASTVNPGGGVANPAPAVPQWAALSGPVTASLNDLGSFENPAAGANVTTSTFGATGTMFIDPTGKPVTWGRTIRTRSNVYIGAVVLGGSGQTVPAFSVWYNDVDNSGASGGGEEGGVDPATPENPGTIKSLVVAADADGDGIADSGLVRLGTLSDPQYSGVTFYYGLRLIDNNSAFNANTAWRGDLDAATDNSATQLVNNRIFPSSVELRDAVEAVTGNNFEGNASNSGFVGYRGGVFNVVTGSDPTPLRNTNVPAADLTAAGRPQYTARADFEFTSQQELMWQQHDGRLDFPGAVAVGGASGGQYTTVPFTLSTQSQLSYGFALAPRSDTGGFASALASRTDLEQLLAGSLYSPATGSTFGATPVAPYASNNIGSASAAYSVLSSTTWFGRNFDYVAAGSALAPARSFAIPNLRPLLVTRNPVAQTSGYKPLPQQPVYPPAVTPSYDRMAPYVTVFGTGQQYAPGEVVYYSNLTNANDPRQGLYVNAFRGRTNGTASPANTADEVSVASAATAAKPWMRYNGPVVPTKVNVNTASFGDLYRAYYLTLSSDTLDPTPEDDGTAPTVSPATNEVGPYAENNTVSPFRMTTREPTALAELFRGMGFTPLAYQSENPADYTAKVAPTGGGGQSAATPTSAVTTTYHPQRMFRSKLTDYVSASESSITPDKMVQLRAAQAAVNAEYHRQMNAEENPTTVRDDVVRRLVPITTRVNGVDTYQMMAQVYSVSRHPYITEVYVSTNPLLTSVGTARGYVAIELHNPYPFPISLANYKIQKVQRVAAAAINTAVGGRDATDIATIADDATAPLIPAGGYIVLDNDASSTAVTVTAPPPPAAPATAATVSRPSYITTTAAAATYYIPNLELVLNSGATSDSELILARPMRATVTALQHRCDSAATALALTNTPISDTTPGMETSEYYVPIDSIDLSGVQPPESPPAFTGSFPWKDTVVPTPPPRTSIQREFSYDYHYARDTSNWRFVYPGRIDGRAVIKQQGLRELKRRHAMSVIPSPTGTEALVPDDVFIGGGWTNPEVSLGAVNTTGTYTNSFSIQIANIGFGGVNGGVTDNSAGTNRFPFGGLAREIDLLQIPFISPVRLRNPAQRLPAELAPAGPNHYIDVISLTRDAAFAEDTDTLDDAEENIGRFAPIVIPQPTPFTKPASPSVWDIDEFPPDFTTSATALANVRYGWARRLFDYVTVRDASSTALPSVAATKQGTVTSPSIANYPVTTNGVPQPIPASASDLTTPNRLKDYSAGIEGLININTAPVPVLASIPWFRGGASAAVDRDSNLIIAQRIVAYRELHGPFRSIFELNKIFGFRTRNPTELTTGLTAPVTAWPTGDAEFGTEPSVATAGTAKAYTGTGFLTTNNGDFTPFGDNTAATGPLYNGGVGPLYPRATPDNSFPGTAGAGNTHIGDPANVVGDYESQYLMLGAVSNLLTTRSDTFTAYLVIEGWRDAGTPNAARVLQRRFAYTLDRSGAGVSIPTPIYVPAAPATSGVTTPVDATPAPLPRVINTTVKATPIVTPTP